MWQEIIQNLQGSSQNFRRAQILRQADVDGPGWWDVQIAEVFHCRMQTVENLRKRLVNEGFELALYGKKRSEPPTPCKLEGETKAKLLALRLGKLPAGYRHIAPAGGRNGSFGNRLDLSRNRSQDAKKMT